MHPFMGIESWDRIGISVEASAKWLQKIAYLDRQLMRIETGHMIARPDYEVKGALARMIWQDAEHYDQLRSRCKQLRMSVVAFDKCPDSDLEKVTATALKAANTLILLISLFEVIKPEQIKAIHAYLQVAQPIVDEPTIHMLRHQLMDREEQVRWGKAAIDELRMQANSEELSESERWKAYLQDLLTAAGGLDQTMKKREAQEHLAVPTLPFKLPKHSTRDSRFTSAVEKFKGIDLQDNIEGRFKMMMYTRYFEMSAAEGVAYVHFSTLGKPWRFYYDTARHIWDEVRHSWFGEAALRSAGYDIYAVPNWTGWYDLTSNELQHEEAYIHLTIAIEKAAMKYPPGKREEWEFCRDVAKNPLMTTFQDFDWADEVVHAGFGQKWIIDELFQGDNHKALEAAKATVVKREAFMARHKDDLSSTSSSFAGGY